MKINEFVTKATSKGFMPATIDQQNDKIKKEIDVKAYLGIKDKKNLIQGIIDDTVLYDNGIYKFNGIDQYVTYTMYCIAAYTSLELSDDIENDYDDLCRAGLLAKILRTFDDEYQSVMSLLQMQCDYVLMDNSVTSRINVFMTALTNGVNKFSDYASDSFKNIDIEKIAEIISNIK